MRSVMIVMLCLPIAFLMIAQPALAGAMVAEDPIGDTNQVANGKRAPGYMDIVGEKLAKKGDVYVFSMEVAASVPDMPVLSQGVKAMFWNWAIDSDPNVYYGGWPLPPGLLTWPEFHITIMCDGEKFSAHVVDHRPLLTGGEEIFWEVPFVIKGSELSLTVGAWIIDDITEFSWGASTSVWTGELVGNYGYNLIDYIWWLPWQS